MAEQGRVTRPIPIGESITTTADPMPFVPPPPASPSKESTDPVDALAREFGITEEQLENTIQKSKDKTADLADIDILLGELKNPDR